MGFGGHTIRRRKYVPMFNESSHLPPMYCYRCHFKQTYPSCDTYCADYLERLIRMQGPENVAAFIAEPVVGATLGAVPPVPDAPWTAATLHRVLTETLFMAKLRALDPEAVGEMAHFFPALFFAFNANDDAVSTDFAPLTKE